MIARAVPLLQSTAPAVVDLDWLDLAVGALLLVVAAGVSLAMQLGVARRLLVGGVRVVVQLVAVGYLLGVLFRSVSPWWTGLVALVMVGFAGHEVLARQERRLAGFGWAYGVGAGAMFLASVGVTTFALTLQLGVDPWWSPRHAIPLLGMVLGNTMTGVGLGLNALTSGLHDRRDAVEARLCLGETMTEASRPMVRAAMRTALLPVVNRMAATGVVFLPGMMTGQILAGADPLQAVRYQMLVTFLIGGGTALGAVVAIQLGLHRLTDDRDRLRLDRLRAERRDAG